MTFQAVSGIIELKTEDRSEDSDDSTLLSGLNTTTSHADLNNSVKSDTKYLSTIADNGSNTQTNLWNCQLISKILFFRYTQDAVKLIEENKYKQESQT